MAHVPLTAPQRQQTSHANLLAYHDRQRSKGFWIKTVVKITCFICIILLGGIAFGPYAALVAAMAGMSLVLRAAPCLLLPYALRVQELASRHAVSEKSPHRTYTIWMDHSLGSVYDKV